MLKRKQKTYVKVSFTSTVKIIVTIIIIVNTVNLEILCMFLLPYEATKMKITAIYYYYNNNIIKDSNNHSSYRILI